MISTQFDSCPDHSGQISKFNNKFLTRILGRGFVFDTILPCIDPFIIELYHLTATAVWITGPSNN
jgi:hypothetical protein